MCEEQYFDTTSGSVVTTVLVGENSVTTSETNGMLSSYRWLAPHPDSRGYVAPTLRCENSGREGMCRASWQTFLFPDPGNVQCWVRSTGIEPHRADTAEVLALIH
jgi:hypothetical protein